MDTCQIDRQTDRLTAASRENTVVMDAFTVVVTCDRATV